jgi:hypothetical protein
MRALVLLVLFISTVAFAQDNRCPDNLKPIAAKLELEFLKKENCVTTKNDANEEVTECSDLLTIEDKIRRLENEVAILRGFEKLIDDIQAQKDKLAVVNPRDAKEVAKDLNEGLRTAYLMEELVREDNPEDFVSKLSTAIKSKSPEEIARPRVFKNTLIEVCNKYGADNKPDFCNEIEGLTESDIVEIGELLKQSPGATQLSDWREALAITTPDGAPYSFASMHSSLRDGGLDLSSSEINLSREQIALLRNLPEIQNKASLSYLDKIKKAKDQLEMTKIFGEMKYLATELENRQKFETQSSLSIIWSELKNDLTLTEDESKACNRAYQNLSDSDLCLAALKNKVSSISPSSLGKKRLEAFLENVESGQSHLESLGTFQSQCMKIEVLNNAQKSGTLPQTCMEKFPPEALQSKLDDIQKLTDQKNGVIANNRDLFDLRNIAMNQIRDCQGTNSKVGEFCSLDLGIDHEVNFLSFEAEKISLYFKGGESLKAIDEICKDDVKQDSPAKVEACRILNPEIEVESEDPAPVKEEKKPKKEEDYDYTPRNTMVRDAWVQGGMNLASTIANGLYQRPYNPYANMGGYQGPYYYTPGYNYGMGSTSDNLLMFNSAYFGPMSYYQSAPGYVPYSAYPIQGSYSHSLSQYFSPYTPLR